jgi:Holliday junction resolvase-like predicted endonuclease
MSGLDLSALPVVPVLAAVCVLLALGWWWSRGRIARANSRRGRRAQVGEVRAEHLLRRAGFRVVDRQVHRTSTMIVDGEDVEIAVRVDLIVKRRGRLFVAEVKTGEVAPSPTHPATRRQLREYAEFFPGHGLLLVDVESERIHRISF